MSGLSGTFWLPPADALRFLAPELLLAGAIATILLTPLFIGRSTRVTAWIAAAGVLAAAAAAWDSWANVAENVEFFGVADATTGVVGPGVIRADGLGCFFRCFLLLFLAAIIAMWSLFDAPRERHAPEFFTLLLASALGMMFMAISTHLLLIVIAIELASLPSFALAGFDRHRRIASEAALKYVIFGAITSGFMIYGVSVLFGVYGTFDLFTLADRMAAQGAALHRSPLASAALLAVFAGVAFKIAAVPFHFWCPDVFEGASLPVATWLSVASKAAGLVLALRMVSALAEPIVPAYVEVTLPAIAWAVGLFAILTMTVANVAALRQFSVRRMLAYSSIAHAGYMLAVGAIVVPAVQSGGATSAVVQYLIVYLFMNLGAFLALGLVQAETGREDIEAFAGLGWRRPLTAFSMTVCLVSLIGLPPLGGFVAKFWIVWALGAGAAASAPPLAALLWVLIAAVVVNTVVSVYYYVAVIRAMYLGGAASLPGEHRTTFLGAAALHLCAVALVLTGTVLAPALKRTGDGVEPAAGPWSVSAATDPGPSRRASEPLMAVE